MPSHKLSFIAAALSGLLISEGNCHPSKQNKAPTASLSAGTYEGVYNEQYDQDFFLGMPYAKPPVGSLRFASTEDYTETWKGTRSATEYGWMCIGYGSDTTNLGSPVNEDCLTLNVVRPAGYDEGDDLPVGVWVHGGSYVMGGSRDPRYNLSAIVDQSVKENKPMVAVSINYRLSYWGFLYSDEVDSAGAGNNAFRDQRVALEWIQDNIEHFGGDPDRVTIWGESAGARSLGMQLVAYDGDHDGLFSAAILESGSPVADFKDAADWQPYYDALVAQTGCGKTSKTLKCLRALPWETLNAIFNGSVSLGVTAPTLTAVIDDDFITAQGAELLKAGKFARVPLLLGNNFDEGTAYAKQGVNTTEQFETYLSGLGLSTTQIAKILALYPDDPAVGVPEAYIGRPPSNPYGYQFKRVAAFAGDYQQHSGRRLLAESYAGADMAVYSYMWNVYVNGIADVYGATHFQEVAFVFDNTNGQGYSANPFEGKPETYIELADLMSKMWVAFIHSHNPNLSGSSKSPAWPRYKTNSPNNLVFDANVTNLRYIARDDYRSTQITYLLDHVFV